MNRRHFVSNVGLQVQQLCELRMISHKKKFAGVKSISSGSRICI